ncbi:MAG: ATP-binding protein [Acidobacteria bacterium]|nr:ATP-binding protein [Acidobacteriota bacterium]
MQGALEMTRPGTEEALEDLLGFAEGALAELGADSSATFAMRLAVEEAVTNVVTHGYAGREPGPVTIRIAREPNALLAEVEDQAPPFPPEAAPEVDPSAPADVRVPGGLGWYLLRQMVDGLSYETRPPGINVLRLTKKLTEEV